MYFAVQKVSQRLQRLSRVLPKDSAVPKCSPGEVKSLATAAHAVKKREIEASQKVLERDRTATRALARLPTANILRNVLLGVFFTSPIIFRPGFAFLRAIADSHSTLLNPDKNPILRGILKPLLYDHFCAGTNRTEIKQTRDRIKSIGYSGVVLCYGKEVKVSRPDAIGSTLSTSPSQIKRWKDGNLETLDMIGPEDWLGMKLTGAGEDVTKALMHNEELPAEFEEALSLICEKTAAQGCRLWIDAEAQILQKSIDRVALRFMRRFNRDGRVVVYNTLQAYLKESRSKLQEHLTLSQREGWTMAIKLVRGAYIGTDQRNLIHNDKQSTDDSYNGIVRDLLSGTNLGFAENEFPSNFKLMLAGHNPESINAAWNLVNSLSAQGRLKAVPEFAQLQGMGDVAGCRFLTERQSNSTKGSVVHDELVKPLMYKCLTWGSVQECMQYLFRRAVENTSSTDRIKDDVRANWNELKQRLFTNTGRRQDR